MQKFTLLLCLIYFSSPISAQSIIEPLPAGVYDMFNKELEKPVFPGGEAAMFKFLGKNIEYPPAARNKNIQGTPVISFIIDETGKLTDIKAIRAVGGGLTEEALRVVNKMPQWTPGKMNGQVVKVRYTLPVRFKLE